MLVTFPPGHRQLFAALQSYCPQLTARFTTKLLLWCCGNYLPTGRLSYTWLRAMEATSHKSYGLDLHENFTEMYKEVTVKF